MFSPGRQSDDGLLDVSWLRAGQTQVLLAVAVVFFGSGIARGAADCPGGHLEFEIFSDQIQACASEGFLACNNTGQGFGCGITRRLPLSATPATVCAGGLSVNGLATITGSNLSISGSARATGDGEHFFSGSVRATVRVRAVGGFMEVNIQKSEARRFIVARIGPGNPNFSTTQILFPDSDMTFDWLIGGDCTPSSSGFNVSGSMTITGQPIPPSTFVWKNATAGSYDDPANWEQNCVPSHDPADPNTAIFRLIRLPSGQLSTAPYGVASVLATADQWLVIGADMSFAGSAELFAQQSGGAPLGNSLAVSDGGRLELVPGSRLTAVDVSVGSGVGVSTLRARGPGTSCDASDDLLVGDQSEGRVEVLDGAVMSVGQRVFIGADGKGSMEISGPAPSSGANLAADHILVNDVATQGGSLTIHSGASVKTRAIEVNNETTTEGRLELDGRGSATTLEVTEKLTVSDSPIPGVHLSIRNGGIIQTTAAVLGDFPAANSFTAAVVASDSAVESKLQVTGSNRDALIIGGRGSAQLEVLNGGLAELNGGLVLGADGGRGSVVIANRDPSLNPGGPGRRAQLKMLGGGLFVGVEKESELTVEDAGLAEIAAPLAIGVGPGLTAASRLNVKSGGELRAAGQTLSVGVESAGKLEVQGFGSNVRCRVLAVGGQTAGTGMVNLQNDGRLTATEAIQIGGAAGQGTGTGSVTVGEGCTLVTNGQLLIGGGAGGGEGTLTLIDQTRSIVRASAGTEVRANGHLKGRGVLNSTITRRDGDIDPGFSPGKITIDGDYAQEDGGRLIIEVGGLEPGRFDVLEVTGSATLAGRVELRFIDGFVPRPGDSVAFLQVAGQITGELTAVSTVVDAPGNRDAAHPAARAAVALEVTPDGATRMTVTRVETLDEAGDVIATEEIATTQPTDTPDDTPVSDRPVETPITTGPAETPVTTRPAASQITDGTSNTILVGEVDTPGPADAEGGREVDETDSIDAAEEQDEHSSNDEADTLVAPPAGGLCGVGIAPLVPMAVLGCLGGTRRARARRPRVGSV